MTTGEIVAKVGEQVTCETGHPICTVARDIISGEIVSADQFMDWTWNYDPKPNDRVIPCPICGKHFMGIVDGATMLHVGDRWRGRGNYV